MNHDSAADHKKSWNRKIYYLQVLEKVLSLLQGTAQGGQGRELQRRTDPEHMPLLMFVGGMLSGKPHRGSYLRGRRGRSVGRWGRLLITRATGECSQFSRV